MGRQAWWIVLLMLVWVAPAAAQDCESREPCCEDESEPSSVSCKKIDMVEARDPNDKAGPSGFSAARHIPGTLRLTYAIYFENKSSATAPASEVRITDPLNLSGLDPSTFSLEQFGFGEEQVATVPHLSAYATSVDLRPSKNAIVNFSCTLDTTSGQLVIRFVTIDPSTMQPTDDPFGGFLPPNTTPPAGEGFVMFSISQRPDLPSGTVLTNQADIVFDLNVPIATPAWTNIVDATPPTSQVAAMPAVTGPTKFQVSWAGQDLDSGLRHFFVYVSKDGGPHELWLPATTALADTFYGAQGHTYGFYTVAEDSVGNVEPAPPVDDATTTVDTTTAAAAALVSVHAQGDRVELVWFVGQGGGPARLWKKAAEGAWAVIAQQSADGTGRVTFVDVDVVPGQRYGYRLGVGDGDAERIFGETWVLVPADFHFKMRGERPNPASGRIFADFSLAEPGEAILELFTVTGRRIATRSAGRLEPGDHQYPIGLDFRLPSGVYLMRLVQGQRSETRKVTVK